MPDSNWSIEYPSTPAQYFHLLRCQVKEPFRLPLIVFTPKSLLRHPRCVSRLEEFSRGGFREILPGPDQVDRVTGVIVCSGKIAVELACRKEVEEREDLAIVRIEQLYPLQTDLLREGLGRYPSEARCTWVQEEPANMGAWSFMRPQLTEILGREPGYVGCGRGGLARSRLASAAQTGTGEDFHHDLWQTGRIKRHPCTT